MSPPRRHDPPPAIVPQLPRGATSRRLATAPLAAAGLRVRLENATLSTTADAITCGSAGQKVFLGNGGDVPHRHQVRLHVPQLPGVIAIRREVNLIGTCLRHQSPCVSYQVLCYLQHTRLCPPHLQEVCATPVQRHERFASEVRLDEGRGCFVNTVLVPQVAAKGERLLFLV